MTVILRPYQQEARDAILREWAEGRKRTLLVLPTGCGKTVCFASVVKEQVGRGGRALIMAHRGELLDQAAEKVKLVSGLECAYEKAGYSSLGSWFPVTVGSVQSLCQTRRLQQFPSDYPNDEATALAATMRVELADGNNASNFTATMYYARDAKATQESSVFNMNVDRDVLFGVGYSANTSVLPGTFANGSVYSFLLVVTDGIETASAMCVVDRAFANLHLSGQPTGGVAIGKFSAATYGNPLFECAFPIVLSGSKTFGPESSMPSNPVEGQLYFVVE